MPENAPKRCFRRDDHRLISAAWAQSLCRIGAFILLLALAAPSIVWASTAEVEAALRDRVAALSGNGAAGSVKIAAPSFIEAFYVARDFRPAWAGTASGRQLIADIADSVAYGFRPSDFHAEALLQLISATEAGDPRSTAEFEIVATDAAIRLLHHLYFGKVDPEKLDADWNFARSPTPGDPAVTLSNFVDADSFSVLVDDLELKHPQYIEMKTALARYRAIEAQGGWPEVPKGEVLKPSMSDPRVPVLRDRLLVTGDFEGAASPDIIYDTNLEAAVKRFQTRHGLEADGVIGSKSIEALNVPVLTRIDQLRLSMERARWILRGVGSDFVLVNIAGANTYFYRDGKAVWRTRSITGQEYRKTPIFRDEISYMELNPTWTVPVSIFHKDKLPRIRKDIGYLARGDYVVRDANGQTLKPSAVNWSSKNPAVTLVQQPGPKNALGLIKFMFPNKYSVYLHDTDDRSLFNKAERNLSSGCVRVENPFDLADLLMEGAPDWNAVRRDEILASGKTTRVDLPKPIPVLLTYYTAWGEDGQVQFRRDIYERDERLLAALDGDFRR